MTPPVDDSETLRRILASTDALLLDFDGPICSVFAGIPASVVAEQLRGVLAGGSYVDLAASVRTATDPFEVLFYAATLGLDEARYVEAAFRAHEVEAVQSAQPTPGAHELIAAWKAAGGRLAIVSNNSSAAIETYLEIHELRNAIDVVSARRNADVSLLKPSAYLIEEALSSLGVYSDSCGFVGDSLTDIRAAHAAHVKAIAYANRYRKLEQFASLSPSIIITSMERLVRIVK